MRQIAIVLYPGFAALDALGPYELLKMLPDTEVRFVAHETGPVATDRDILTVGVTHTLSLRRLRRGCFSCQAPKPIPRRPWRMKSFLLGCATPTQHRNGPHRFVPGRWYWQLQACLREGPRRRIGRRNRPSRVSALRRAATGASYVAERSGPRLAYRPASILLWQSSTRVTVGIGLK